MSQIDSRLANRILIGLGVGALAGSLVLLMGAFAPGLVKLARELSTAVLDPFGQIFLRMLFFVVIPLIFASLVIGVVQLGRLSDLGPLAGKTFSLFALNMIIGVALGLLMMNILEPGAQLDAQTQARLTAEYGSAAESYVQRRGEQPAMSFALLVDMLMPRNLLGAFVGNDRNILGEVLPLILFALLVGAAGTQLAPERRESLQRAMETVAELMTRIVHFALRLAPYAVPALIFSVIVKAGFEILIALGLFVLGCLAVMALHLFGTFSAWLKLGTRRKPRDFFKAVAPVLVTAFSTSSSSATLPASIATARESLGVRSSVAGFVLPLGATMNMSGTALYEGCVVLFVAQVFGVDLSLTQQLTLLTLSVLSAVAVAGIPGGSLPLIAGLLMTFGIPPEGIGIVLGADRILDMARTVVNVGADLVTAVVIEDRTRT
ncbi:MAG: dicarboxylate/amino acid:cation symporter [Gammaproteobacteria bacterium]|nr:dicarboxylate/amino acid:cation symporter [Gammaproteobacteria bacterium]